MINNKKVTGIIVAAGNSIRYGKGCNKNFEIIDNKAVLSYSLRAFNKSEYIDEIVIAIKENELYEVEDIVDESKIDKDVIFVIGGNTRKESVYNCIKRIDSDIVIIHDGARPLIKQSYISNCIESMDEFRGVTLGVKSKDTIKITDNRGIVVNTTNRSNTWLIQTPQCFDRKTLLDMHEKYMNEDVTDDCSLLEKDDYTIKIVPGDYTNIKITTKEDLDIVKKLLLK